MFFSFENNVAFLYSLIILLTLYFGLVFILVITGFNFVIFLVVCKFFSPFAVFTALGCRGWVFLVLDMADEIRELLEKLRFFEEESKKIFCNSMTIEDEQGCEAWAVGKFLMNEKINKDVMYMVFRSLWYTKEWVNFVEMIDGIFW